MAKVLTNLVIATFAGVALAMASETFSLGISFGTIMWSAIGLTVLLAAAGRSVRPKPPSNIDSTSTGAFTFKCKSFTVLVDLTAKTAALSVAHASDVLGKKNGAPREHADNKAFAESFPIEGFTLGEVYPVTKTKAINNSYSGTVGGQMVTMSGGPVKLYEQPTGISTIVFRGALMEEKNESWGLYRGEDQGNFVSVRINNVSDLDVAAFQAWWRTFGTCIEQVKEAKRIDFEQRAAQVRQEIQLNKKHEEQAQVQALKAALATSNAGFLRMLESAGVRGDFKRWALDAANAINWCIALDRTGRGFITIGNDSWTGEFANASAVIVPGSGDKQAHLEVLVKDTVFETEHLTKRRLRFMHGEAAEVIQEWADRINMLG